MSPTNEQRKLKLVKDVSFAGSLFILCGIAMSANLLGYFFIHPVEQLITTIICAAAMGYATALFFRSLLKFRQL